MPDVPAERRRAPRYPLVLAAEVVELPRGAKLSARTSDVSRSGCYIEDQLHAPLKNGMPDSERHSFRVDDLSRAASQARS